MAECPPVWAVHAEEDAPAHGNNGEAWGCWGSCQDLQTQAHKSNRTPNVPHTAHPRPPRAMRLRPSEVASKLPEGKYAPDKWRKWNNLLPRS